MNACTICGAIATPLPRRNALECTECFSTTSVTIPNDEEIAKFYASFNETYSGGGRVAGRSERLQRYAAKYLSVVQKVRRAGKLIDVGSSLNPFPNLAAGAGYRVSVADYVRPRTLDAEIEFIPASLDDPNMAPDIARKFDIVTAFAVIEHCRFPHVAAENLASLCAANGVVVLTTPLWGTFYDRHTAGLTGWFCPPEHLHILSKQGMTRLFGAVGCNLIHFERFELNLLRKFARYAMCAGEGGAGSLLQAISNPTWKRLRENRTPVGQEVGLYIFTRSAQTSS